MERERESGKSMLLEWLDDDMCVSVQEIKFYVIHFKYLCSEDKLKFSTLL